MHENTTQAKSSDIYPFYIAPADAHAEGVRQQPPGYGQGSGGVPRQNSGRPQNQQLKTILPIVDLV